MVVLKRPVDEPQAGRVRELAQQMGFATDCSENRVDTSTILVHCPNPTLHRWSTSSWFSGRPTLHCRIAVLLEVKCRNGVGHARIHWCGLLDYLAILLDVPAFFLALAVTTAQEHVPASTIHAGVFFLFIFVKIAIPVLASLRWLRVCSGERRKLKTLLDASREKNSAE